MDRSYKGPCVVYMKQVDDATTDNKAVGDGCFKIWQADYDAAKGKWCTEKIISDDGHLSVVIPDDIQAGYYLVRLEMLALHSAQDGPPDPQFYVGCAQLFVQSSGTASPSTLAIGEGTYDLSIPGMTYDIYQDPLPPYPMYGSPIYQSNKLQVDKRDTMVPIHQPQTGRVHSDPRQKFPPTPTSRAVGMYVLQSDITNHIN